jgi:hypothetical protein
MATSASHITAKQARFTIVETPSSLAGLRQVGHL